MNQSAPLPIADVIRSTRLAAGLSQAELADACRTTQSYISGLECGQISLSLAMLTRLADGLGTTVSILTEDV